MPIIFSPAADGTYPVVGQRVERRIPAHVVFRIARHGIIDVFAVGAAVFLHRIRKVKFSRTPNK